jgi:hypothetical protein
MVKPQVQLTIGFVAAIVLMAAAVWLWLHNVIIVAAPVGALAIGAAWAGVDNALIYPAERAKRQMLQTPETPDTPGTTGIPPASPSTDSREFTVPH